MSAPHEKAIAALEALQPATVVDPALAYGSVRLSDALDRDTFPAGPKPAAVVAQLIRDKRLLDSNPRLNLATFVATSVEKECEELMSEALNVNAIDEEEYPSATEIHAQCVRQLADLTNAEGVCGTATIGSSEAIMLGVLAMKWAWRARREAAGKPTDRPNIVVPSSIHVCHEKAALYFDVELRQVPLTPDALTVPASAIVARCDENTIGVVAVLGSTYTGHFDDVAALSDALEVFNAANGTDIGIHVDGASGGFVAPFLFPDLKADFRVPRVVSINMSGHKFGLMVAGIGWIMFRSRAHLPDKLIFADQYLGNDQISFTLNFSKSFAHICGQAYLFQRLGRAGYTQVISDCYAVAMGLATALTATGRFIVRSPVAPEAGLPLVAFSLKERGVGYDEFDVAEVLREHGWVVPAYPLAKGAEEHKVLRVVCREDFSPGLAASLARHVVEAVEKLEKQVARVGAAVRASGAWRAAVNRTHSLARASAKAKGAAVTDNGVDYVGRHGGAC